MSVFLVFWKCRSVIWAGLIWLALLHLESLIWLQSSGSWTVIEWSKATSLTRLVVGWLTAEWHVSSGLAQAFLRGKRRCGIRRQAPMHSMLSLCSNCLLMHHWSKWVTWLIPESMREGTIKGGDIGRSYWGLISITNYHSTEHKQCHSILTNEDTVILIFLMRKFKFRETWVLIQVVQLINASTKA